MTHGEPTPAIHTIVNELVLTRLRQGLSQDQVARALGVTRQEVSEWETSTGQVRLSTLAAWAAVLGLRVELAAGAPAPVLRTADGRPAKPMMTTHVLLTGPARAEVLPVVLREHPGPVFIATGAGPGVGADDSVPVDLATLVTLLAGHAAQLLATPAAVLVVDLDRLPDDQANPLRECVSRARSAAWTVVVLTENAETVPQNLRANLGTALTATSTAHIDAVPFAGEAGVWHVA